MFRRNYSVVEGSPELEGDPNTGWRTPMLEGKTPML